MPRPLESPRPESDATETQIAQLLKEADRLIQSINTSFDLSALMAVNMRGFEASVAVAEMPKISYDFGDISSSTMNTASISSSPAPMIFDDSRIDAEIELIHLCCKNIDRNLSSIGLSPARMPALGTSRGISISDNNDVGKDPSSGRDIDAAHVADLHTSIPDWHATAENSLTTNRRSRKMHTFGDSVTQQTLRIVGEASRSCNKSGTPTATSSKRHRSAFKEDSYKCPVCWESVRQREPVSTKCGHVFCNTCIQSVLRLTHKCPMCNKKMSSRQTFRIYI
ncbi:uncharacterized protein LOC115634230 [Scaptodrosophila lebanonensis]|uniref:Uncharacterized protein LOC115634230 n=1 Tax=Drosophila lebanonensis TaxID=7225 RepID=A0A6J2UKC6_DROLE|nr:uncharacterized protein LOC115634230 [Scaptodrosophila lebanonensis]